MLNADLIQKLKSFLEDDAYSTAEKAVATAKANLETATKKLAEAEKKLEDAIPAELKELLKVKETGKGKKSSATGKSREFPWTTKAELADAIKATKTGKIGFRVKSDADFHKKLLTLIGTDPKFKVEESQAWNYVSLK